MLIQEEMLGCSGTLFTRAFKLVYSEKYLQDGETTYSVFICCILLDITLEKKCKIKRYSVAAIAKHRETDIPHSSLYFVTI